MHWNPGDMLTAARGSRSFAVPPRPLSPARWVGARRLLTVDAIVPRRFQARAPESPGRADLRSNWFAG